MHVCLHNLTIQIFSIGHIGQIILSLARPSSPVKSILTFPLAVDCILSPMTFFTFPFLLLFSGWSEFLLLPVEPVLVPADPGRHLEIPVSVIVAMKSLEVGKNLLELFRGLGGLQPVLETGCFPVNLRKDRPILEVLKENIICTSLKVKVWFWWAQKQGGIISKLRSFTTPAFLPHKGCQQQVRTA